MDPYEILGDKSEFIDQQTLKLQEEPESVRRSFTALIHR